MISGGYRNYLVIILSDCDGYYYLWYGFRNEIVIFEGLCKMYQFVIIVMNDNFYFYVIWRNLVNRN